MVQPIWDVVVISAEGAAVGWRGRRVGGGFTSVQVLTSTTHVHKHIQNKSQSASAPFRRQRAAHQLIRLACFLAWTAACTLSTAQRP